MGQTLLLSLVALAFSTSLFLTWIFIRLAPRLRLVDHPGARKVHTRPTPRGGGLAIFLGCLAAWAYAGTTPEGMPDWLGPVEQVRFFLLCSGMVLLGLLDDWLNLPWPLRLSTQGVLALAAVVGVLPGADLGSVPAAVAVLWIVGLVNAFNMLDNMDALSAGVAILAAGRLAVLGDRESPRAMELILLSSAAGFLIFNRPPARIFMGDAGSTLLGFFLGVRSLCGEVVQGDTPRTWLVPLCVLAVPLYDLTTVVALRLWQGRSPFHADKQHLSHRLVGLGLSQPAAVGVICLLALASGTAGGIVQAATPQAAWLVAVAVLIGWFAVAAIEYIPYLRSLK